MFSCNILSVSAISWTTSLEQQYARCSFCSSYSSIRNWSSLLIISSRFSLCLSRSASVASLLTKYFSYSSSMRSSLRLEYLKVQFIMWLEAEGRSSMVILHLEYFICTYMWAVLLVCEVQLVDSHQIALRHDINLPSIFRTDTDVLLLVATLEVT